MRQPKWWMRAYGNDEQKIKYGWYEKKNKINDKQMKNWHHHIYSYIVSM